MYEEDYNDNEEDYYDYEKDISEKSDHYNRTGSDDRCGRLHQLYENECGRK